MMIATYGQKDQKNVKLVIVESPAKATTIGNILGKDYKVLASFGHVRDLPKSAGEIPAAYKGASWSRLGVNVDEDFSALYVIQKDSKRHISELKKACKDADEIILATDEDREGESISWHLLEILKPKVPVKRIAFHEITADAIKNALKSPRSVNEQLVRAQETRRILDRLFGYELSPVLWRKIRGRLSAGRVQSVALRLVVEREEERRAFMKSAYWDAEAALSRDGKSFSATLTTVKGQRVAGGKDFDPATGSLKKEGSSAPIWLDEEKINTLLEILKAAVPWHVVSLEEKESTQRPYPPFITSTLQQAASGVLGFSPRKTMQVAQKLYEGVNMGDGAREGLITYMRTDSVVLSEKALQEAAAYITDQFGANYHTRRQYKTKSKLAQEAHEAIRPTNIRYTPDSVARYLSQDELRLYQLIWSRTIASQMADAKIMRTTVDLEAKSEEETAAFRANGSVVIFPGFLKVMSGQQKDKELPALAVGMTVSTAAGADILLEGLSATSHETQPPARYTEASLVRRLEEEGIGRPSTYAPTVAVIQQRGYVERVGTALAPTYIGIAVIFLLREHFSDYVDLGFTSRMEDKLDAIAEGQQDWLSFLKGFYFGETADGKGLKPRVHDSFSSVDFPVIPVGEDAEGDAIVIRVGKTAPFLQREFKDGQTETATIPEKVYFDELKVEKAVHILNTKSKREEGLGTCPTTGERVYLLEGPYGPYVQLGESDGDEKPKRMGLPRGMSPDEVTFEKALQLLELPRKLGEHPDTGKSVSVSIGRFGPYVVHDGDFRSINAAVLLTITLEEALAILAQPKNSRGAKKLLRNLREATDDSPAIDLYEGRYGPYVTDGTTNASLPKTQSPDTLKIDEALALLVKAAEKNAAKAKAAPRKKAAAKKKTAAKKPAAKKAAAKKPAAKKKNQAEGA